VLREISGPAGRLEALLDEPTGGAGLRAAVVFGHPHPQYGGTMHTKVVFQSAKALARIGCAVLRFNFRGTGTSAGHFDEGIGEQDDVRAALEVMEQRYPGAPLWAGGMSFGSWVALTAAARDPRVSLLLGVAMPVNKYDFGQVAASAKPKFFIHGEFDEICSEKEIREFYARAAEPKEVVIIDGADHLFDGRVSAVGDAIEDLLGDWPVRT
jgi:alpha/beta superfamily hydrolase